MNMGTSDPDHTTDEIFQGKSQELRDLYGHLLSELQKIGPVRESPAHNAIRLESRKIFASAAIRDNTVHVVFRTEYPIENPRVQFLKVVDEDKYQHVIRVASDGDIDEELLKWLKDSYQLSM